MDSPDYRYAKWLLSKAIPVGECLWCHLAADTGGYGQAAGGTAHRAVWIGLKGPTNGLHVLHTCDNRMCINIDHLFLGTQQDNVDDKVAKNRQSKFSCKLITTEQQKEIRQLFSEGLTYAQIATRYMVSKNTIWRNLRG